MKILTFLLSFLFGLGLVAQPVVTELTPNFITLGTSGTVTISGSGFTNATEVDFGNNSVPFLVLNDSTISASISPINTQSIGSVFVSVTDPTGTSTPTCGAKFTFTGSWFAIVGELSGFDEFPVPANTPVTNQPLTGYELNGAAITPDDITALIAGRDTNGNGVVVDVKTEDLSNTTINVGGNTTTPIGIAITPNGNEALVALSESSQVVPIDLTTNPPTVGAAIAVPGPYGIAITPNGTTAYVSSVALNTVIPINLLTNTTGTPIPVGTSPEGIAITPDGTKVYVANFGDNTVSVISTATNMVTATVPVGTGPIAVAITANGKLALVANNTSANVTPISIPSNIPGTPIPLVAGTLPNGIAITPDSSLAYVTETNPIQAVPIDLTTMTAGTPIILTGSPGPLGIAISPDPAPAADFTVTTSFAKTPTVFDASESQTAVGTIVSYAWNFGDGQTLTTTSPVVSHVYAASGPYTVTLTVTNSAGTSTTQTFTGQTVSNNGGPMAVCTQVIFIPPAPPINFVGKKHKNKFILQTEYFNLLTWQDPDPGVVAFQIFRNGVLIATVKASKLCFIDHGRSKHERDIYMIVAVNRFGMLSPPATIIVQ